MFSALILFVWDKLHFFAFRCADDLISHISLLISFTIIALQYLARPHFVDLSLLTFTLAFYFDVLPIVLH